MPGNIAITLRILGHISDTIEQGFSSSKRDIYYLDPEIFGNQRIVDRHIDDIAFTIGVDRAALHVVGLETPALPGKGVAFGFTDEISGYRQPRPKD